MKNLWIKLTHMSLNMFSILILIESKIYELNFLHIWVMLRVSASPWKLLQYLKLVTVVIFSDVIFK